MQAGNAWVRVWSTLPDGSSVITLSLTLCAIYAQTQRGQKLTTLNLLTMPSFSVTTPSCDPSASSQPFWFRIRIAEPNRPMVLLLWLNSPTEAVRRGEKQMAESSFPSKNFTGGFTVLHKEWRTALAASLLMSSRCCASIDWNIPLIHPCPNLHKIWIAHNTPTLPSIR